MPPSEVFAPDLLAGQSALVTGGGTGLGKAAAAELVACGCRVLVAGRRPEVVEAAADELGCEWAAGDVRSPEDAARLVDTALERFARLDMLVNNAGGQYFAPAEAIEAKGWRAVMALNVGGVLAMSEAAYARAFRGAGRGTIINITLSPHHGLTGMVHSSASRAAAEGVTRELAARWAEDGVTVVAAAAGHFKTDALQKYPEAVREGAARTVPLQRLGRPEEHAWLIALLASPLGPSLSGSTVTLDGARDNWFGPWPPPNLQGDSGEVPIEERRPVRH
jgi:citronellol/citronellal dehydrogenase